MFRLFAASRMVIVSIREQILCHFTKCGIQKCCCRGFFTITRRQIQLGPRRHPHAVVASLGKDGTPGGINCSAYLAIVGAKIELSELIVFIIAQCDNLADFLHSLITRLSLQDLLPERKLDAGLRFGHGGKGGLFLGVILHIKILGDGDSREDAEDDQHGYDFDQGKTQTVNN